MRLTLSEAGIDHLKRWEGLRLEAYLPTPNDVPTLGYGHTTGVAMGLTCLEVQAEAWLDEDADWAEATVRRTVTVALNQTQYDVLVSLTFNIGAGAFRRSTLLKVLNEGHYTKVPREIRRWVYQDGEVVNGLVRRRKIEAQLFQHACEV